MRIELEADTSGAVKYLGAKEAAVPRATAAGVRRVFDHAAGIYKSRVKRIYNGPTSKIPTRAQARAFRRTNRKPKSIGGRGALEWNRSGELMAGIHTEVRPTRASVGIQGKAEAYAERRHNLGVTWQPKKPALGVVRRNPFATETKEIVEPQAAKLFRDEFNKEMKRAG